MGFALERVWPLLNADLLRILGPERYETWISHVRLLRLDLDELLVGVAGSPERNRILALAGGPAGECLRRITNRKTHLVVVSEPALFSSPRPGGTSLPERSFETFCVGRSNRLAARAALRFADGSCPSLILAGPSGSGKTHLLRAVEQDLRRRVRTPALLVTGEEFVRQYGDARERGQEAGFRRRCLGTSVCLFDDVDFLCERIEPQEEFLRIYLALVESGKRVALTCTKPPRLLEGLTRSCRAHLRAHEEVQLDRPDASTAFEILRARAPEAPAGTLEVLSREIGSNLRDALTCLERLRSSGPPTPTRARAFLRDWRVRWSDALNLADIVRAAADDFRVPERDIYSHKRSAARARQACYYLARKLLAEPYGTIGRHFGGRNHSTVVLAVRKLRQDRRRLDRVRGLERRLIATR